MCLTLTELEGDKDVGFILEERGVAVMTKAVNYLTVREGENSRVFRAGGGGGRWWGGKWSSGEKVEY